MCTFLIDVNYCVLLIIGIINRPVANANHTIFSISNHFCLLLWNDQANIVLATNEHSEEKKCIHITRRVDKRAKEYYDYQLSLILFRTCSVDKKKRVIFFFFSVIDIFCSPYKQRLWIFFLFDRLLVRQKALRYPPSSYMIITH